MAGRLDILGMTLVATVSLVVGGGSPTFGEESQRRPISLISSRLLMVQGRPALPVSDLALALGGVSQLDEAAACYRIQPGATSLLRFDATGRGAVPRTGRLQAGRDTAGAAGGAVPSQPPSLYIGTVLAAERLILQGREPYVLLEDLAEMFGGAARFDASLGQWFIVGAQPGRILAFR